MLRNQKGIHFIQVDSSFNRAVVDYDPELWTADKLTSVRAYRGMLQTFL
jgi:hypothetical protein